jgi:hypothetical protein
VADEEHVKILLQGVEVWNAWRAANPSLRPDLSGGSLINANLVNANLVNANLSNTDLTSADLTEANLSDADLYRADLRHAFLFRTILINADLRGAKLYGAHLAATILTRTSLRGANLEQVQLTFAVFADVDLNSVIGLDTCSHMGPCNIDYRTLEKSGPLPLSFLRGVGLPDMLIDYLPSL